MTQKDLLAIRCNALSYGYNITWIDVTRMWAEEYSKFLENEQLSQEECENGKWLIQDIKELQCIDRNKKEALRKTKDIVEKIFKKSNITTLEEGLKITSNVKYLDEYLKYDGLLKNMFFEARTIICDMMKSPEIVNGKLSKDDSTDKAKEKLIKNGYVVVRGVINKSEYRDIEDECKKVENILNKSEPQDNTINWSSRRIENIATSKRKGKDIVINGSLNKLIDGNTAQSILSIIGINREHFKEAKQFLRDSAYYQIIKMNSLQNSIDEQDKLHIDTFQPVYKIWIPLENITSVDIPLTVSPGSHKTTAERLIYERIVLNDLYEGNMKDRHKYDINMAFRYNAKDAVLSNLKIKKPKKIIAEAGDIVICNTRAFHCRSKVESYSERRCIHMELRSKRFWSGMHL